MVKLVHLFIFFQTEALKDKSEESLGVEYFLVQISRAIS